MELTTLIDMIFDFLKTRYKSYLPFQGYFLDSLRDFLKKKVKELASELQTKHSFQGVPPTDLIVNLKVK